MKSAYELAMERLEKDDPDGAVSLTDEQKQELAEVDRRFKARIAEREIFLREQLAEAQVKGEVTEIQQIEQQVVNERIRLEEEREQAKDRIRAQSS